MNQPQAIIFIDLALWSYNRYNSRKTSHHEVPVTTVSTQNQFNRYWNCTLLVIIYHFMVTASLQCVYIGPSLPVFRTGFYFPVNLRISFCRGYIVAPVE